MHLHAPLSTFRRMIAALVDFFQAEGINLMEKWNNKQEWQHARLDWTNSPIRQLQVNSFIRRDADAYFVVEEFK